MKASFLIAIAENDDATDPESKNILRKAFDAAKVPAEIEVYAGARHGWCAIDSQVYNQVAGRKGLGPAARTVQEVARLIVPNLLGISGSLRAGSFNTALLRAAQRGAGPGVSLDIATLHGIPLYDGDLEASSGIPAAVAALKARVAASDGVLIATPEYNNSMPGVLKNAIDWLSRPAADIGSVFGGRPFAIIGASPGGFGTVLAQNAWLATMKALGVNLWSGGRVTVARVSTLLDANGEISDAATLQQVATFVQGFAAYAAAHRRG